MSEVLAQLEKKGSGELKRVIVATSQRSDTQHTFDIRSLLPNDYSKLTLDNFALANVKINYEQNSGPGAYNLMPTSYNASTGVLTCNASYSYSSDGYRFYIMYDVICYYT